MTPAQTGKIAKPFKPLAGLTAASQRRRLPKRGTPTRRRRPDAGPGLRSLGSAGRGVGRPSPRLLYRRYFAVAASSYDVVPSVTPAANSDFVPQSVSAMARSARCDGVSYVLTQARVPFVS